MHDGPVLFFWHGSVWMTQHWVGCVCTNFKRNWLRFVSKYHSNTRLYSCVCLCLATCVALVTWLFIFVVCPLQAAIKTARRREKQYAAERHVMHRGVQYGVLKQTNRPRFGHLCWQNITHTFDSVCGRDGMKYGTPESLREKHTGQ